MTEERGMTLERLGGEDVVARWVKRFYDMVGEHPLLAPMFKDLETSRKKQFAYFVEVFGGPADYTATYGKPFLRFKHRNFKIGQPERDAWMELAMASLKSEVQDQTVLEDMEAWLGGMADKMINHHPEKHDAYYFQQ